jgi:hypothetical protein
MPIPQAPRPRRSMPSLTSARLRVLGAIWFCGIVSTYSWAVRFESTPGQPAVATARFPKGSSVNLDPERFTLLLFAHPRCPCTRSTLDELDRLVARCSGQLAVRVMFYSDPALGAEWTRSGLWEHAVRIAGADVQADPFGSMAARFGVHTSGEVLFYSPAGELLFQGGITSGRGHAGDNPGCDAITSIVQGRAPTSRVTPVFGCSFTPSPPPP